MLNTVVRTLALSDNGILKGQIQWTAGMLTITEARVQTLRIHRWLVCLR